jgi:hypothetical protein
VIPKILHRCVPEVVPDRYAEFWDRFCAMHPDWQHVTWQDPLNPDDWELGFLCSTVALPGRSWLG